MPSGLTSCQGLRCRRTFLTLSIFIAVWLLALLALLPATRRPQHSRSRISTRLLYHQKTAPPQSSSLPPPTIDELELDVQAPAGCPVIDRTRPCRTLPGAEDVLVIIRTGASELEEKLPSQFQTLLQCAPHFLLLSDYEEQYCEHHVYDTFDRTLPELKSTAAEFAYYRDLQRVGKQAAIAKAKKSTSAAQDHAGDARRYGKTSNPGWALDKYKFLPMIHETLALRPDFKWYIFIEPDTFIFWENLLAWLSTRDPTASHYLGSPMQIGTDRFAYGGAGVVISNPALRAIDGQYMSNQTDWEERTQKHWAGDCILGMALARTGSRLVYSVPLLSPGSPETVDFGRKMYGRQVWCTPAVSYHHMDADSMARFWSYRESAAPGHIIYASDIFDAFINGTLRDEATNWNNLITYPHPKPIAKLVTADAAACRKACQEQSECKQWHFARTGNQGGYERLCTIDKGFMLGAEATGLGAEEESTSGWMLDRIASFREQMTDVCKGVKDWA